MRDRLFNGNLPSISQSTDNRLYAVAPSILVALIEVMPLILELSAESGDDLLDLAGLEGGLCMREARFVSPTSDGVHVDMLEVGFMGCLLKLKQEG